MAKDVLDSPGVVRHEEPVAALESVPVERQRLVVDRVGDEQRDELLRVLVGPIGVGAAGDDRVDPMGHHVVTADEQLAGRLGRRIRRARSKRVVLPGVAGRDRPIDLIGRDLEEPRGRRPLAGDRPVALAAAGLEEDVDADHARHEERLGVEDRPVDVRFRGEVDHRIRLADERPDDGRVGDVAVHEAEPARLLAVGLDGCEIGPVAGVGQLVEDDDPGAVTAGEDVTDKAAADESGTAGDEKARTGRRPWGGRSRRPVPGHSSRSAPTCRGGSSRPAASSSAAISAARRREETVPASAHWPS